MYIATLDVRLRRQSDPCQSAPCFNGAVYEPGRQTSFNVTV